jgi:hypothetical protein
VPITSRSMSLRFSSGMPEASGDFAVEVAESARRHFVE